jgi:hypothetical protein
MSLDLEILWTDSRRGKVATFRGLQAVISAVPGGKWNYEVAPIEDSSMARLGTASSEASAVQAAERLLRKHGHA